jgi:hypothetical protein
MSTVTNTIQSTSTLDEVSWARELEDWVECEEAKADEHWSSVVTGWFTSNSTNAAADKRSEEAIQWQTELSKYRDEVTASRKCIPVMIDHSGPLDEDEEPFWEI